MESFNSIHIYTEGDLNFTSGSFLDSGTTTSDPGTTPSDPTPSPGSGWDPGSGPSDPAPSPGGGWDPGPTPSDPSPGGGFGGEIFPGGGTINQLDTLDLHQIRLSYVEPVSNFSGYGMSVDENHSVFVGSGTGNTPIIDTFSLYGGGTTHINDEIHLFPDSHSIESTAHISTIELSGILSDHGTLTLSQSSSADHDSLLRHLVDVGIGVGTYHSHIW